jgi:hypothetical protein
MMLPLLLAAVTSISFQPDATLDGKVASVLPTASEERWLQIPWRTDVMQARVDARREGKPLFFWVMDGHPLGCT